jgi:polysaccharide export outer membrane protein
MRRCHTPFLISMLLVLSACSSAPPFDAKAVVQEWASFMDRDYVLRPGDRLALSFFRFAEMDHEVAVSPNGTVALRRLPEQLRASGMSIAAFRRKVQAEYNKVLEDQEVSVSLVQAAVQTVYVAGEVSNPGPVAYVPGMTLTQAVAAAGGFLITVHWSDIRVLRNRGRASDKTYRVNTDAILFEGSPDFLVLPGDVVWAQTSAVADVGNWVELYIRRLLPFPIAGVALPVQ